jgi:hypothetical protein
VAGTDELTFLLDRFEWTAPGRLSVGGGWKGMRTRDLEDPALIVHSGDEIHRLQAINGVLDSTRYWSAIFPWEGDPTAIEAATLEIAGSFVVELPVPHRGSRHRRFGRTRLTVREIEPEDAAHAEGVVEGTDVMAAYAAAILAREEAAEAQGELKLARAAVIRAREDAEHERARRTSDASRLREALETLRRVAEESLERERAAAQRLAGELKGVEAELAGERAETARLQEELAAVVEARDDATARLRAQSAEIERLQGLLEEARRDARRAGEQSDRLGRTIAQGRAAAEDDR